MAKMKALSAVIIFSAAFAAPVLARDAVGPGYGAEPQLVTNYRSNYRGPYDQNSRGAYNQSGASFYGEPQLGARYAAARGHATTFGRRCLSACRGHPLVKIKHLPPTDLTDSSPSNCGKCAANFQVDAQSTVHSNSRRVSSRNFDLNCEARTARTKQSSPIIRPA